MPSRLDRGGLGRHPRQRPRRPDLKKYAVAAIVALVPAFAGLATAYGSTAIASLSPADTTTTSTTSTTPSSGGKKVFRSQYCKARISQNNPSTWGCATITVDPHVVAAGDTTMVTYSFKAKIGLQFVEVCDTGMFNVTGFKCLYQHKFRALRRGRVIKRTLSLKAPTAGNYGNQYLDNYIRFYKKGRAKVNLTTFYWLTKNAAVCVTTASQPDACSH
jgi:hypothetical protein